VASNLEQGLQIGSDITGLDLHSLFARLGGGKGELESAQAAGDGGGSSSE
jgi:hypothetical protein